MSAHLWTVLATLIAGFEVWAIRDKRPNNTWSAWFYTHIRAYLVTRLVAYPLLAWTAWHWLIDPGPVDANDLPSVAIGVILALVATTRRPGNIR